MHFFGLGQNTQARRDASSEDWLASSLRPSSPEQTGNCASPPDRPSPADIFDAAPATPTRTSVPDVPSAEALRRHDPTTYLVEIETSISDTVSLDLLTEAVRLPCDHIFNADSVAGLQAAYASCPCCRAAIPYTQRVFPAVPEMQAFSALFAREFPNGARQVSFEVATDFVIRIIEGDISVPNALYVAPSSNIGAHVAATTGSMLPQLAPPAVDQLAHQAGQSLVHELRDPPPVPGAVEPLFVQVNEAMQNTNAGETSIGAGPAATTPELTYVRALSEYNQSTAPQSRVRCLMTLVHQAGTPAQGQAVGDIIAALLRSDRNDAVRQGAVSAWVVLKGTQGAAMLSEVANNDRDVDVVRAAIVGLELCGTPYERAMAMFRNRHDAEMRRQGLQQLAQVAHTPAEEAAVDSILRGPT